MALDSISKRTQVAATVRENGAPIVVTKGGNGQSINQATGALEGLVSPTPPVSTYALIQQYENYQIDGVTTLRGDLKLFLSAEDLVAAGTLLEVNDLVEILGSDYRVIDPRVFAIAGVPIFYEAQVRNV